jgi:hypothetical protein
MPAAGGARRGATAEGRERLNTNNSSRHNNNSSRHNNKCVLTLREVRSVLLKVGHDVDAIWRRIEAIAIKAVLSAEERLLFYR